MLLHYSIFVRSKHFFFWMNHTLNGKRNGLFILATSAFIQNSLWAFGVHFSALFFCVVSRVSVFPEASATSATCQTIALWPFPNPFPSCWPLKRRGNCDFQVAGGSQKITKKTPSFIEEATIMFRFIEQHSHYVPSDSHSYLMSRRPPSHSLDQILMLRKLWKQKKTPTRRSLNRCHIRMSVHTAAICGVATSS